MVETLTSRTSVLVVGAGGGIGAAVCVRLEALGHDVARVMRPSNETPRLGGDDEHVGGGRVFYCDIGNTASVSALRTALADLRFDLILFCTGILGPARFDGRNQQEIKDQYWINAVAPVLVAEQLLEFLPSGSGGFLFLGSRWASISETRDNNFAFYRSSKSALNFLVQSFYFSHCRRKSIYAYTVHPGWVQTRMGGRGAQITPSQAADTLVNFIFRLPKQSYHGFYDTSGAIIPF